MSDKFPMPAYSDGIRKGTQTRFGGLNHNPGAGDGEIYQMENLCSNYYPLVATRRKRIRIAPPASWEKTDPPVEHIIWQGKPGGMWAGRKLLWMDGTTMWYNGRESSYIFQSEEEDRSFVEMNGEIIIAPDMMAYKPEGDELTNLGASVTLTGAYFKDGTLYGEDAKANTIETGYQGIADLFRVGDAITISGSIRDANNKTVIIREIEGTQLHFYENSFQNTGNILQQTITLKRVVPKLKFIFEHGNRLWGCDGNTIYASKLGDPRNWNVYDGLDTDSWTASTNTSDPFTGGCSYGSYPCFFKERSVCRIYGSTPSNFELIESATLGVAAGSHKSLAIAGEMLFYLSDNGICMYMGGVPSVLNRSFGTERYKNAVGGSDGLKYYVSMQERGAEGEKGWHLFVYDTQRGLWHEEEAKRILNFAYLKGKGNLFYLDSEGDVWAEGNHMELEEELGELLENWNTYGEEPARLLEEDDFDWSVEFTDFTDDSPNKKGVSKIQIRVDLDEGASLTVKLMMDSNGEWITPAGGTVEDAGKRSYYLAIIQQRADHYRMRIEGNGGCKIYSITREYYVGSELKSQPGRQ